MYHALRKPVHALQLIALLAMALIPAGWMPRSHGDGGLVITLCTAQGIVTTALEPAGDQDRPEERDRVAPGNCAFAGALSAALLPPAPEAMPAAWLPGRATPAAGPAQPVAIATPPPRPPGQGPPARS